MIVEDDRTAEQRITHRILVIGTDKFLSGWGQAHLGKSVAAWACTSETVDAVEQRIRSRGDIQRVRVVEEGKRRYRPPQGTAHFHIYVA